MTNRFIPGVSLNAYLSADLIDDADDDDFDDDDDDSVIEVSGGDDEVDYNCVQLNRAAMKKLIAYAERCWGEGWQEQVR